MHTTKLRKVGGSMMLAVPPALLAILQIQSGDMIDISVEDGKLIAVPPKRRRYTLDELLEQCKPRARRSREDRDWLSDAPAGNELI